MQLESGMFVEPVPHAFVLVSGVVVADQLSQVSNAAPSGRRTVVRQDWALVAVAGPAGWGGDWSGSSW